MSRRARAWSEALLVLALLAGAFALFRMRPPGSAIMPSPTILSSPPGAQRLPYHRAAFGKIWADVDGNGCNTRDDVLLRDLVTGRPSTLRRQGGCDHDVVAGTFHDPYSGHDLTFTDLKDPTQARAATIDHVVPLKLAWEQGAWAWTPERRLAFANDPLNLTFTSGRVNTSKGAHGADTWPPDGFSVDRCWYATRYLAVKQRYGLAVTAAEQPRLDAMRATCPKR